MSKRKKRQNRDAQSPGTVLNININLASPNHENDDIQDYRSAYKAILKEKAAGRRNWRDDVAVLGAIASIVALILLYWYA